MNGRIFSIEEFSVYDGPGIRTTVFMKGCPLRCSWCHNPEGQNNEIEIVKSPNGCIKCGACSDSGLLTEDSIKKCPMNLIRLCGENICSSVLCERLLKNRHLLTGGGVTFSGGEPLMQHKFVTECIYNLKGKLHCAVQTSGYCEPDLFESVLDVADLFLFDLKIADDSEHIRYTGVSNQNILKNFETLAKSDVSFIVRIPLIPGVTDTAENISSIAEIMKECKVSYAELLPYNKMAGSKYKLVNREYKPGFDDQANPDIRKDIFESYNIKIKIL